MWLYTLRHLIASVHDLLESENIHKLHSVIVIILTDVLQIFKMSVDLPTLPSVEFEDIKMNYPPRIQFEFYPNSSDSPAEDVVIQVNGFKTPFNFIFHLDPIGE